MKLTLIKAAKNASIGEVVTFSQRDGTEALAKGIARYPTVGELGTTAHLTVGEVCKQFGIPNPNEIQAENAKRAKSKK